MEEYSIDPNRADELVSVEEVTELLHEPRHLARDQRKIAHFLSRVLNTLHAYRRQIQLLHNDITQIQLSARQVGSATTLSPLDAVRYLTPEQMAQVLDAHMAEKLKLLEQLQADAENVRREALSRLNHLKFVVTAIVEDPNTPDDVRRRLADVLARATPAEPAPPDTPGPGLGALFD